MIGSVFVTVKQIRWNHSEEYHWVVLGSMVTSILGRIYQASLFHIRIWSLRQTSRPLSMFRITRYRKPLVISGQVCHAILSRPITWCHSTYTFLHSSIVRQFGISRPEGLNQYHVNDRLLASVPWSSIWLI